MVTEHNNTRALWRNIEERKLTHSAAHYLTTILELRQRLGYARVTDVAETLQVSRGAASRAMHLLRERGWIEEDPHRMLVLTEEGTRQARSVQYNHRVFEQFLREIVGLEPGVAHEDACKMEHLLSRQTTQGLTRLIRALHEHPRVLQAIKRQLERLEH